MRLPANTIIEIPLTTKSETAFAFERAVQIANAVKKAINGTVTNFVTGSGGR
jgi:hypothetical protein